MIGSTLAPTLADSGRAYVADDAPQGPTILHALDIPALPGTLPTTPQLLLAAGSASPGWRRADIMVSRDGGESYAVGATIAAAATIGSALDVLPPGTATRWDRRSTVDVALANDTATLQSASEAAVLAGANLAVLGDEMIQFAVATPLGPNRFRLSTLLRGRRGSEAAVSVHVPGERFVLLDDRLTTLAVPAEALGATLLFKAVGPGEDVSALVAQTVVPRGVSLRPLSPATVTVTPTAVGDRVVAWQRRSRAGFAWSDGTDAPLAEDSERYRVTVSAGSVIVRTADVATTSWTYPAAEYLSDLAAAPSGLSVAVAQVSATVGVGPATDAPVP